MKCFLETPALPFAFGKNAVGHFTTDMIVLKDLRYQRWQRNDKYEETPPTQKNQIGSSNPWFGQIDFSSVYNMGCMKETSP